MRRRSPGRQAHRADRGATAVIVSIVAVLLFGMAALAAELTDMYSRDRAVQTTADLSALAGAQDLPDSCAAFASALTYLNDPDNGVADDTAPSTFGVTAARMRDGSRSNGEIEVLTAAQTSLPTTAGSCSRTGRFVRVTTPPRTKAFALGTAVGAGSGEVRATAMVELRGLDVSVLPFSLPSNCPSGPNYLYVDNGGSVGGPSAGSEPDYDPDGNTNGPHVTGVVADDPRTPTSMAVAVNRLEKNPAGAGNDVSFDFHLLDADGTTTRSPAAPVPGQPATSVAGATRAGPRNWQATFQVVVPATVLAAPGSWRVRAYQASGTAKWTPDSAVGTLIVGLPSVPGCPDPSTGDFGLLSSPRSDGGSAQQQRFRNFARGLDHPLFEVTNPTVDIACASDGLPYPDGILDDNLPASRTESCVDVKPGETAALPTDGLIDGRGGEPGRLVGSPGPTSDDDCVVDGDDDLSWTTKSGKTIVNTVLSCYLEPGASLSDVRTGTPDSLVASVADDPRFFFVPVIDTTARPRNSSGGAQFWPVKAFRGAFVTDEQDGGDATCLGDENCNGLVFNNGATQLKAIQAFTFPLRALPREVAQPGNGGDYYEGGTKDFLLVE